MNSKFGRKYQLTIYPGDYIQTFVPGNTFVDSLKDQVNQLSLLLGKIQSLSNFNISTLISLLNEIQKQANQIINLINSLQSVLNIPASVISNIETVIIQQVTNLIASVQSATVIPVPFLNEFKNNALTQISALTKYLPQIPSPFTSFNSFDSGGNSNPVVIENPFTLTFNIRRAALASTNTGTFQIYNLSESTRNQLYKDKTNLLASRKIVLRAGYFEPLPIIFSGNIKWCTSCRMQGQTNFITEIEAFDGGFEMVNAYTTKSWDGDVAKQDVVNQLIRDVIVAGGTTVPLTSGYIHQYSDVEKNICIGEYSWPRLVTETQSACFIDSGQINVLPEDDCFTGTFPQISSETGLLGAPKRSETYVIAEMLFEPSLVVGQQVNLLTRSQKMFNGDYKIVGINHIGTISDAVGGKCQSNVSLFSFKKNAQLIGQVLSLT